MPSDPLSPFLFIIAIEALHVTIQEAKQKNIFEGIQVGSNKISISHLQFADDALIMGKWSLENAKNLCRILQCFHMPSGLKVNFHKSKFFGVGVTYNETERFASILRFQPSTLPCTYLGLPIGSNMNKSSNWKPVIDKFHKKLTSWKVRSLSYSGRLTLFKSVLRALGTYFFSLFKAPKCVINYLEKLRRNFIWGGYLYCNKMTWIAWNKICSSSKNGGLEVGSLHDSNLAMLGKWLSFSPWKSIIKLPKSFSCANINLHSVFRRKVGDGSSIRFWKDLWVGDSCLKNNFPRLYLLETKKNCTIKDRCCCLNGPNNFSWAWRRSPTLGSEASQFSGLMELLHQFTTSNTPDNWIFTLHSFRTYFVSAMRKHIEESTLGSTIGETKWNNTLPIKVNIFAWRLALDRLPTRFNLDSRGVDLDSVRCAICDDAIETIQHLFVDCTISKSLWSMVTRW
ncbi:putative RNA-directed DNA polymerase [Tanacetum coccineum]